MLAWSSARRGITEAVIAAVVGSYAYNATITLGADRRRQLGIDQLLHPAFEQPAQQVLEVAVAQVRDQVVQAGIMPLPTGARVTVLWGSANRDQLVFGDPDEFRLDRDPSSNLLYGAGIHVCPGALLARLELRSLVTALLAGTERLRRLHDPPPMRATYPAGGYRSAWVVLDPPDLPDRSEGASH